jgi:hypothetical protein
MRLRLFLPVLLVSVFMVCPRSVMSQSFHYAADCATDVDNATIHVPAKDKLQLPGGRLLEKRDTIAAYTSEGTCAGYGVWKEAGVTFAVRGPDSTNQGVEGYSSNERFKFEVFDVSSSTAVKISSSVRYTSCSKIPLPLCQEDGRYSSGSIHQVAGFLSDASSTDSPGEEPAVAELENFTATLDGTTAILTWQITREANKMDVEVQHKAPGEDTFTTFRAVEEGSRPNQSAPYRTRVEGLLPGTHQFRLRRVGPDGISAAALPTVSVHVKLKQELTLRGPAPHPVRRSARLVFTVKQDGKATVTLFDVLGQRVRTFYSRTAETGREHEIVISADGLSSGTYFVRLRAPSGTKTKRLVVVR